MPNKEALKKRIIKHIQKKTELLSELNRLNANIQYYMALNVKNNLFIQRLNVRIPEVLLELSKETRKFDMESIALTGGITDEDLADCMQEIDKTAIEKNIKEVEDLTIKILAINKEAGKINAEEDPPNFSSEAYKNLLN